jgi:Ni/Co efflux regulator RcnB
MFKEAGRRETSMKKLAFMALAGATLAAPLAFAPEAAAHGGDRHGRYDRDDRRDYRRDRRDRDWDRDDRRDERRAYRRGYRDAQRHDRWDDRRYNGYHYEGRWYYGPPPRHWRDHARYDYRGWRRGDRLPGYYRDRYRVVDYRHYHLRPPPRGYHYVRDDRGDFLLVGIATGVILGLVLGSH